MFVAREQGPVGFERDVVLKLVPDGDPSYSLAAEQLAREATIGSRLNHPNILRTHDFFSRDGRVVLVAEHVDGTTLAELRAALSARQERLSDASAIYIGVTVLDALAHAHAQLDAGGMKAPIAHGGVHAGHVVLGTDGAVKLAGFGAPSNVANPPISAGNLPALDGEKADVRAAGVLLWELLTGRDASAGLEPLSALRSDLPRELAAAVGAALDVANAKRAISCAEVASWIKKVARFASARDELRARVTAMIPATPEPAFPAPSGESALESARIPLTGWSVRLAPIANKMLAVRSGFPRLDSALRSLLLKMRAQLATRVPKLDLWIQQHPRAAVGIGAAPMLSVVLLVLVSILGRKGDAAAQSGTASAARATAAPSNARGSLSRGRFVPAAPAPPTPAATDMMLAVADSPSLPPAKAESRSAPPIADNGGPSTTVANKAETRNLAADSVAHPAPSAASKPTPPPPKGFGFLTVHSSLSYAYVYVQLFRYGHVERRLTVRCGKRFVSLGNPRPGGGEPTWYAPSRTVEVPCGGSAEVTMMPKWIP